MTKLLREGILGNTGKMQRKDKKPVRAKMSPSLLKWELSGNPARWNGPLQPSEVVT